MKIKPFELQAILNAAINEMMRHPNWYTKSLPKAKELYLWLTNINWDEPDKDVIQIDELPL